jgi:hypothetical protein
MKKRTRSILEELNNLGAARDNDLIIENTAMNIIESAINLLDKINKEYDKDTAAELERKFLSSVKLSDSRKFKRSMHRVLERKDNNNS